MKSIRRYIWKCYLLHTYYRWSRIASGIGLDLIILQSLLTPNSSIGRGTLEIGSIVRRILKPYWNLVLRDRVAGVFAGDLRSVHAHGCTNQYTECARRYYVSDWIHRCGAIDQARMSLLYYTGYAARMEGTKINYQLTSRGTSRSARLIPLAIVTVENHPSY